MQNANVVKQNAIVLSNAAALAYAIVSSIGEKDVSRTLNNESLTRNKIEHLVISRLTACISTNL